MTPAKNKKNPAAIALVVIALGLVVFQAAQLFRLIARYAVDVPFWDQWGFYDPFFEPHGLWEIFSWQHGPHRQGVGSFIIQAVNAATNWDQRAQAFTIAAVMTTAATTFLWLKRRLFGSLQWYDAVPVLMILSLQPMEIYFSTLNVSHGALPLLLIILTCLALTIQNVLLRCGLATACYFLTLFTGYGFLAQPILPVLLFIDCLHLIRKRQWQPAGITAGAFICCLAAIACFYHDYSFSHTADCFLAGEQRWYHYPVFMAVMFSVALLPGKFLSLPSIAIGIFIIAALLCMLAATFVNLRHQDRRYPRHQTVFLLITFTLVFSAASAAGRLTLGLEAATATRYVPLIMPGLLGAYLVFVSFPALAGSKIIMPLVFACTVFAMLTGWPWRHYYIAAHCCTVKSAWVAAFIQTGDITIADTVAGYPVHPEPEQTNLARKLAWLRGNRYSLFRESAPADDPEAAE